MSCVVQTDSLAPSHAQNLEIISQLNQFVNRTVCFLRYPGVGMRYGESGTMWSPARFTDYSPSPPPWPTDPRDMRRRPVYWSEKFASCELLDRGINICLVMCKISCLFMKVLFFTKMSIDIKLYDKLYIIVIKSFLSCRHHENLKKFVHWNNTTLSQMRLIIRL